MLGYNFAQLQNTGGRTVTDDERIRPLTDYEPTKLAFSITEFCKATTISRRMLYTLWERDQGPPRVDVGGRVLIPYEGGKAWLYDQPGA